MKIIMVFSKHIKFTYYPNATGSVIIFCPPLVRLYHEALQLVVI